MKIHAAYFYFTKQTGRAKEKIIFGQGATPKMSFGSDHSSFLLGAIALVKMNPAYLQSQSRWRPKFACGAARLTVGGFSVFE
jgi:hypothetical protein